MANTPAPPTTFQLRVTLEDIYPPIWRRVLVPANITLAKLHDVIQAAMGWTNSHLHEFRIGDAKYSIPDRELDDIYGPDHDEQDYRLDQVISHAGMTFGYVYDFGDHWEHEIIVEDILHSDTKRPSASCLDGERSGPPEDVGGPYTYPEFLDVLADPDHEEHEHYVEWLGDGYDPEAFDVAEVNERLGDIFLGQQRR